LGDQGLIFDKQARSSPVAIALVALIEDVFNLNDFLYSTPEGWHIGSGGCEPTALNVFVLDCAIGV